MRKIPMRDIVEWAESPQGFYVDRYWGPRGWELQERPIDLAPYHAAILQHCFTPDESGRLPYDIIAWCEPAKSGKSAIAGLVAEYMALHGDTGSDIVMASNKKDQAASLMFASASDSIKMNPHLPNVSGTRYELTFSNGNTIKAIASNASGEAGARFSLACFDELWAYRYADQTRLWSEFKTDPTRRNSVKLAIGYAGYYHSELWLETLERGKRGKPVPELRHIRNDDGEPCCWANGRHFTFWSHKTRQPWQTDAWLASQRRGLRAPEYRRMIKTEFVEGEGDFIDQDVWESLIDPNYDPDWDRRSRPVYVGLDVAVAPGGDDCAVVGVVPHEGRVFLRFHKVWKGKRRKRELRLSETVYPYLLEKQKEHRNRIAGVFYDPRFAVKLTQDLRDAGIRCVEVPQTHQTRGPKDTALYEMAVNRELVLYDDPQIRKAAAGASAKELGNGLIFLQKAGSAKIDLLIALSNCVSEARGGDKTQGGSLTYIKPGSVGKVVPPASDGRPEGQSKLESYLDKWRREQARRKPKQTGLRRRR
jgi:hypothetical protein